MTVEFTDFAKKELQHIYNYYAKVANDKVAIKIVDKILDDIELLIDYPNLGNKETLLTSLNKNHRYIICGHYKIIFYATEKVIYVTDIFDCRQNPVKIKERNK